MRQAYEPIIGLEIHAQVLTDSKMFCGCSADVFGAQPNTHVCPVCMGMPGSLPVINRRAVEATIMAGLALGCQIAQDSVFARKNYYYPDLPKGYQISQYELPLCQNGRVEIEADEGKKRVRVRRVHLEEDTGKLTHVGSYSLVDFNRSGVPLLEIVSEPDIRSADEAHAYLTKLRTLLRYLGVSTGDMEKGAMRCEANISVRPVGSSEFGTKVEIKNLNSFRSVRMALAYEIERQIEAYENGEPVVQVTMGWDEGRARTVLQRSKEEAHDYRYFPEPDLPPLVVHREWVGEIEARLPEELPDEKIGRYQTDYKLPADLSASLANDRNVAEYFDAEVDLSDSREYGVEPKAIANWFAVELFRLMNESGTSAEDIRAPSGSSAQLLSMVQQGTINLNTAKSVFAEVFQSGKQPRAIVEARGLAQVSDEGVLEKTVVEILAQHPDAVERYRSGEKKVVGWLMGQVMRITQGKANPQLVRQILQKELDSK